MMPPQFKMAARGFVGVKTLKLKENFKFYYHIPHDMKMCRWFYQSFTEIQNGRHGSTSIVFVGTKTKKIVRNY